MDSGQNPISPMPGNGSNSATSAPVFSSATATLNSRRNRSARPASANSMVTPVQPMSPAGEAIPALPAAKPKSPVNKGLIIGLVVLAIAVVAGVVALTMLPNGNNPVSTVIKDSAFNRFANYIISGKDSPDSIADINRQDNALRTAINNPESREAFLATGRTLLDKFLEYFNSSKLAQDQGITEQANSLANSYEAVTLIYSADMPNNSELLNKYLADGLEESLAFVKSTFSPLLESDNFQATEYAEYAMNYMDTQLQIYDLYNKNQCINANKIIDNACVAKIDFSNVDVDRASQDRVNALVIKSNVVDSLFNSTESIMESMEGDSK